MVLLEAQAYGLPIVAYACKCGPRDIITDGVDGFLVEEGNIEELAAHIKHLIKQDAMRKQMGKEAAKASARFDEERIMQQWINLFERL
jgi:glycosyltransferase involved in cell wall biosynthesis